jgi:hypothetical protein
MAQGNEKEHRVQVVFDADAMAVVENLKRARGSKTTTADVIRDALGFYEWVRRQLDEGFQLGLLRDGKAVREVVLPFLSK